MQFQLNLVIENVSVVTNIDAIPLNYIIIIIMYLFLFIYLLKSHIKKCFF